MLSMLQLYKGDIDGWSPPFHHSNGDAPEKLQRQMLWAVYHLIAGQSLPSQTARHARGVVGFLARPVPVSILWRWRQQVGVAQE